MKRYLIALLLLGVFLFGCTQQPTSTSTAGATEVVGAAETQEVGGEVTDLSQDIGAVDVSDAELDQATQ